MDIEFVGFLLINSPVLLRHQGDVGLERNSCIVVMLHLSLSPQCHCACAQYARKKQEYGEDKSAAGNTWITGGGIKSIQGLQVSEGIQAGAGA